MRSCIPSYFQHPHYEKEAIKTKAQSSPAKLEGIPGLASINTVQHLGQMKGNTTWTLFCTINDLFYSVFRILSVLYE